MQAAQVQNPTVWKQVYQEAVFELDHGHLRPKLEAARRAIEERLTEMFARGGTYREFMELGDAQRTLQFLERNEFDS